MDLNEARDIINHADEQIVAALKERMRAVTEVARYKQAHNLPVLDEKREEKVLERVAAMAGDDMSDMADAASTQAVSIDLVFDIIVYSVMSCVQILN